MEITKEALIERGFNSIGHSYLEMQGEFTNSMTKSISVVFLENKASVYVNEYFDCVDEDGEDIQECSIISIPNCQTMEQIDQLNSLFVTP